MQPTQLVYVVVFLGFSPDPAGVYSLLLQAKEIDLFGNTRRAFEELLAPSKKD
jgi:hypothetical protein